MGDDWIIRDCEEYLYSVAKCGGQRAADEALAPVERGLSRNPEGFHKTVFPDIYIARTVLRWVGREIVLAHRLWFRTDAQERAVTLLWVETIRPEEIGSNDDEIPF